MRTVVATGVLSAPPGGRLTTSAQCDQGSGEPRLSFEVAAPSRCGFAAGDTGCPPRRALDGRRDPASADSGYSKQSGRLDCSALPRTRRHRRPGRRGRSGGAGRHRRRLRNAARRVAVGGDDSRRPPPPEPVVTDLSPTFWRRKAECRDALTCANAKGLTPKTERYGGRDGLLRAEEEVLTSV